MLATRIITTTDYAYIGYVVAWGNHPDTGAIRLAGLMDPMLAVQFIEDAKAEDGMVWIAVVDCHELYQPMSLDHIYAIWASAIDHVRIVCL